MGGRGQRRASRFAAAFAAAFGIGFVSLSQSARADCGAGEKAWTAPGPMNASLSEDGTDSATIAQGTVLCRDRTGTLARRQDQQNGWIEIPHELKEADPSSFPKDIPSEKSGDTGQKGAPCNINESEPHRPPQGKDLPADPSDIVTAPVPDTKPVKPGSDPVPPQVPPAPLNPPAATQDNTVTTIGNAASISQGASDNELYQAAKSVREIVERSAADDQKRLSDAYKDIPEAALADNLTRAQTNLTEASVAFQSPVQGMDSGDRIRFKNLFTDASDKAALGLSAIQEDKERRNVLGDQSPFAQLMGTDSANPLAKSAALADIFGAVQPASATSNDALVNRLLMLNGLSQEQQAQLVARLNLVENRLVRLESGATKTIPVLHNGYIFGAGKTGLDCSSFVSSVLPPDVRKGRFTTFDMYSMYQLLRTGALPKPPLYQPDRAKVIRQASEAFTPVNLYAGEEPRTGDLLVYHVSWTPVGHVFIVKSYDSKLMRAEVIEAAQSAGTIRERGLPLTADPPSKPVRIIRAGLYGLRIKPVSNRACSYRDHVTQPQAETSAPQEAPAPGSGSGAAL